MHRSQNGPNWYRAIWISDFHLGTRDCKAALLLDFLRHNESEYLYLVGDIFDGWALRRTWYWDQRHNDVIQKLLRKARKGTKVCYIPGHHDAFARDLLHLQLGRIVIKPHAVHTTADGRQLLVLHGDEFDGIVRSSAWLSRMGSVAYDLALKLNRWFNAARRRLGLPYWSLSAYLKHRAKRAVQYITRFEEAVVGEAHRWEVDGVVCVHFPLMAGRNQGRAFDLDRAADLVTLTGTPFLNTQLDPEPDASADPFCSVEAAIQRTIDDVMKLVPTARCSPERCRTWRGCCVPQPTGRRPPPRR